MLAKAPSYEAVDEKQKGSILEQVDRLLAHPVFKSSKRCPIFLRYVVERTLESKSDPKRDHPVKERSIGVEVFGREPGYDTNHDPIVRVTAGEVRKRIAQYYHEAGHESEIRIELPAGSYVPEFLSPHPATRLAPLTVTEGDEASAASPHRKPFWHTAVRKGWLLGWAAAAVALVLITSLMARSGRSVKRNAMEDFWGTVLSSSAPLVICIGQPPVGSTQNIAHPVQESQSLKDFIRGSDHIALSDGMALADLAAFLGKHGKRYRVQSSSGTSLTDLRQGSAILIAGFDNPWTVRALDPLRFRLVQGSSTPNIFSIQDRENPSRNDWSVDMGQTYSRVTEDFAIIARFVDTVSDQVEVIAAGIGENGTISAGEFLTDPRFLEQIAARAPRDWAHKNLEGVIGTQVIDEKSGPPRLLAVHFW